jgi:hypothetical protein
VKVDIRYTPGIIFPWKVVKHGTNECVQVYGESMAYSSYNEAVNESHREGHVVVDEDFSKQKLEGLKQETCDLGSIDLDKYIKTIDKYTDQNRPSDFGAQELKAGDTLKQIQVFRKQKLKELYDQCTTDQQHLFKMMYKSLDEIPEPKIDWAIQQCEKTIIKNRKKHE